MVRKIITFIALGINDKVFILCANVDSFYKEREHIEYYECCLTTILLPTAGAAELLYFMLLQNVVVVMGILPLYLCLTPSIGVVLNIGNI